MMAEDRTFTCVRCGNTWPYDEIDKEPCPATRKCVCSACADKARERLSPKPQDFRVENNFRAAGPSSVAAASAAEGARLNDLHRTIWRALSVKPRTADEIAGDLNLVLNTARARITDLRNAGWIRDTGDRRATEAGRAATVWEAVTERVAA